MARSNIISSSVIVTHQHSTQLSAILQTKQIVSKNKLKIFKPLYQHFIDQ